MSMAQILHSPSHFSSSPNSSSSNSLTCLAPQSEEENENITEEVAPNNNKNDNSRNSLSEGLVLNQTDQRDQLSLLALLVTLFRKSWAGCKSDRRELCAMEIGLPTNVRHVAHVTFDRFNGFLGLPVEFEPEVPRRAPSASTTVFGVSTESMQLSYDTRGNSVPTILLLMQRHLYGQGGLQAEGIFRINAENGQEEYVRDQLNRGLIPAGIDVHCLAGLIKAWFRELPSGVLDSLSPEQVMQCQTEEECAELVRRLPHTDGALLDWAINLMADVVEQEHVNKMNAHNIAMVFAPNMTQMADPLTALMYVVQVMNFLKMLILRTLREREDCIVELIPASRLEPFDENGHQSPQFCIENSENNNNDSEQSFIFEEPVVEDPCNSALGILAADLEGHNHSSEKQSSIRDQSYESPNIQVHELLSHSDGSKVKSAKVSDHAFSSKSKVGQSSDSYIQKIPVRLNTKQSVDRVAAPVEKTRGISNLSHIDSRLERIEAWR